MTAPADAGISILWALVVGGFLGLCYDFLRPLRSRHHGPADAVFVVIAVLGWIWYNFQICAGDIRLGGTACLGLGMLLWLGTLSMLIRRVFYWFWLVIFRIFRILSMPFVKFFVKILQFSKKVFAYGKKRGYNSKSDRNPPQTSGGIYYE